MKVNLAFGALIFFACGASTTFAQHSGAATQRPVMVVLNDYSGETIATMVPSGNEKYLRKIREDFEGIQAALPGVDIRELVRENFCRELAGTPAYLCDQVTVSDVGERPRTVSVPAGAATPVLVMLSIEYIVDIYFDGIKIVATYGIHGAHEHLRTGLDKLKPSADPVLQVGYWSEAPSEIRGSPVRLKPKPSKKQLQKHAAARAYWLEGSPSRLENEIRRALSDVAAIGRMALPKLAPEAANSAYANWVSELPRASQLRDEGKLACLKNGCDAYILRMDESRVWRFFPGSLPPYMVSVSRSAATTGR